MAHIAYLKSLLSLQGLVVADVGAGDGRFARELSQNGAIVRAIEVDPAKVAKARGVPSPGVEVLLGRAEALPLESQSCDLVCCFFSFHHIPIESQARAIEEMCRVLRPAGRLHVVEPYPHGTMFDVLRLVEDETVVQTNSHRVLGSLGDDPGFRLLARHDYVLTLDFADFDGYLDRIVRSDPDRLANFAQVEGAMKDAFDQLSVLVDGRHLLHQPCAAYHFQR